MSFLDYNYRTPDQQQALSAPTLDFQNIAGPVRVIDVLLDKHNPRWDEYKGPSSMGAILYRSINSQAADTKEQEEAYEGIAYPLSIGSYTIPLKNEIVLLVKGPGQNIDITSGDEKMYYIGVYSLWNNPHHGAFPPAAQMPDVNLGQGIQESDKFAPLQITPGDTLIQGRLGQSIRLGGGVVEDSPWSNEDNINKPLLILRAGQKEVENGFNPIFEDINSDQSSIYMTTNHVVPLTLANSKRNAYNKVPDTPNNYDNSQLLFNSDRIVLNAKRDDILVSSVNSIGLNSDSVNIDGSDYLCLDAPKMYLGIDARINEGAAKQPIVLGHRMEQFLIDVLDQMISLASAVGSAKTIKGDTIPTANKEGTVVANVLRQKRSDLNPKGVSLLKSKKIFVE